MRDQVMSDLKHDEGWVPHAYQDHLGFTTIGFGFLIDREKGGELPREVAEFWLQKVVDRLTSSLRLALPSWEQYPDNVQRALLNMAYQLGVGGLMRFRKTLVLIDQKKFEAAADEALRSKWAEQTPTRAQRVTDWIRSA